MSEGDRIGIFIYGYGFGNSPSLINAGNALAREGFAVDYFTCNTFIGDLCFDNPKINIYRLEESDKAVSRGFVGHIRGLLPLFLCKPLGRLHVRLDQLRGKLLDILFYEKRRAEVEDSFLSSIKSYVGKAKEIIEENRYKCFIGVEPGGLMAAVMLGKEQHVPVIYYNLELHLSSESHTIWETVLKKQEKEFNRDAAFTITLDEDRAKLLSKDNEISLSAILTVPVCAEGPKFVGKTDWLRRKFNLSETDKIILYAGFISEWAMCEELAISATAWRENRVLVLHTHGYNDEGYIQKIKKYEGKNIKISLDPVPYDDLQSFLASADIGVALYKDLGKNFTLIASASGKLSHYLKSGLPVITNDYPSMRKVIDEYKCGVCVASPKKITEAMEIIFGNYETMRSNAYRCYEDKYMFSKQFAKVIGRIKNL